MARAHFVTYLTNSNGDTIPGATVSVREPDTEALIAETVYAEDDPGSTELGNPFVADADGKCEIWLTAPKIVDLFIQKTGFDPVTIRAIAHQLTASTLTVAEAGTPLAQRATLNFLAGFDLADDAGNDETEVAIDLTEVSTFTDHSARHEDGGADEISLTGLAGTPAALTTHESTYDHTDIAANETAIANHIADAADAHDASAISVVDAGGLLAATEVEAALAELATDIDNREADLTAHIELATDAHDASAISVLDSGGKFTATNVETVLLEVVNQLDNVDNAVTAHFSDNGAHEAFPVGAIFMAAVATNPATLLGYGTWQAFAEGQVLVGRAAGDPDFGTVEQTGGAKTHNHDDHGSNDVTPNSGTFSRATTETHSTESHLMPYIVVYMWKRTA